MAELVRIEERGEVAVVRIDRPPANATNEALLEAGHAVLDELRAAEPGAVVLTGRDGFFSAGADLKEAPTLDREGQRRMVDGINRIFAGWYGFERPVVCAVNGHAIAGGLILALCGDYRVVARHGRFGLTELRAGIPYPAVAMAVVRAELSPSAARELVLGADLVGPERAVELGVFDELVEPGDAVDRGVAVAEQRAQLPRFAYGYIKRQLRADVIAAAEALFAAGTDPLEGSWVGDETAEAAAATLQRGRG